MATVRYQVDGVPPGWADAFFPTPTLTPAATFSVTHRIAASWGTEWVDSPAPRGRGTLSASPEWHPPSSVAPDAFRPDVAVLDIRGMGPPVRYMPSRRAEVPVPVGSISYPPAPVAMRGRKVGGRRSMAWPRTILRWPSLGGRGGET